MKSPLIGSKNVIYQDNRQVIYSVDVDFGSFSKEYTVRDTGERSGLVVCQTDSILLVKQYRFLINAMSWEIPGGRVDEGESPEVAAVRECAEETGLECRGLELLLKYHPGLDTNQNPTYIFHSSEFSTKVAFQPDLREVVDLEWFPMNICLSMISDGEIVDGLTVIALLAYNQIRK